eukprot:TRINITY_DN17164_c0_g1_i1.p1 TRINITY_DN17164_c0_g1~~TRINITY_DN17164_c0_g1_i1.p1  ORF type:complete len:413 (-),score=82.83 TRINITY_DN17164_c0_g1_i1:75-1313(-)
MSYRLLQKQCGVEPTTSSEAAVAATQRQSRSGGGHHESGNQRRGGHHGGGHHAGTGHGGEDSSGGYYNSGPSTGGRADRGGGGGGGAGGGGGGFYGGGYSGGSAHTPSSVTNINYPKPTGGFGGSSAQKAHVESMRAATAAAAKTERPTCDVAVRSGLGLEALRERKIKEELERQARRDAARSKRLNEETKKDREDEAQLEACENQAWDDVGQYEVKFEAALIVRIATTFGANSVWTKIAEARARGAEIPLDPRRVYLLAHPDKCRMPEASDATAILNAQRPPEMTEARPRAAGTTTARPPQTSSVRTPKAEQSATAPAESEANETPEAPQTPVNVAAPADTTSGAEVSVQQDVGDGEERRVDPEDGVTRSLAELHEKYKGVYIPEDVDTYWRLECTPLVVKPKPKPKSRRF